MTNEYAKSNRKKCEEISELDWWSGEAPEDRIYQAAYIMAEWKDRQFKAEKQQLIKKACEWLKENARNYHSAYATEDRLIADFKKATKGGEE